MNVIIDNTTAKEIFGKKQNKTTVSRIKQTNVKNCLKKTCTKCQKEDWKINFPATGNVCKNCKKDICAKQYKKQKEIKDN